MNLDLDLTATPFSRRGSWFAVSQIDGELFLRTVRGGAGHREVLRLDVGGPATVTSAGGTLELRGPAGELAITLDGPGRALLRVTRGTVVLEPQARNTYDAVVPEGVSRWRFVDSGARRNYRVVVDGRSEFAARWDGVRNTQARITVSAGAEPADAPTDVTVDEYDSAVPAAGAGFEVVATGAQQAFDTWCARHTAGIPGDLAPAARLAAFVAWGAYVPADGFLRRESMLMSKNGMTHVWSWDHCFNALALWRDPAAAADQLLTLFDQQDAHGALPDHVDDAGLQFNFVKPPIHGWTLDLLLDRDGITPDVAAALHEPLARWTRWWFAHRDYTGDGVPSYNHGNDSGWDNSTVFAGGVPVQSPDLLAFLVLQVRTLERSSQRLGRASEAHDWRELGARTLDLLLERFWVDGRFVARDTLSGAVVESRSLLTLMPLALGDLLPAEQFAACVEQLRAHLTPFGPATEPLDSPAYDDDGYWRGPVWAPTTLLLVDGLRRGGETGLAAEIARNFVATCAAAGMAENFSATTGAGLRDRSMTWTASVFLLLAADPPL